MELNILSSVLIIAYIPSALEDNRTVVVLTFVDFREGSFDRLEHGACLNAFRNKGASLHCWLISCVGEQ